MSWSILPAQLQGIGKSLFVGAHEGGELLESGNELANTDLTDRPTLAYLYEQLPVFRVHGKYLWRQMHLFRR